MGIALTIVSLIAIVAWLGWGAAGVTLERIHRNHKRRAIRSLRARKERDELRGVIDALGISEDNQRELLTLVRQLRERPESGRCKVLLRKKVEEVYASKNSSVEC